jgi:hypothetical protein
MQEKTQPKDGYLGYKRTSSGIGKKSLNLVSFLTKRYQGSVRFQEAVKEVK